MTAAAQTQSLTSERDLNGFVAPEVILVGASTGGIDALRRLVAGLPKELPASVLVVQHTHPTSPQLLAEILQRAGDIEVSYAADGQPLETGHVYIAPADQHLLVEGGRMRVLHGPKENLSRPAIDPLFRSAAVHYGPRAIGVILTGSLNDGTSGLAALKECGGVSVVQSPDDAHTPDMPASAIRHVAVDHCLPLSKIAPLLVRLVNTPIPKAKAAVPATIKLEAEAAAMKADGMSANDQLGTRTPLTCPDCGGVLWEIRGERPLRFRCHVGHAMTAEVLAEQQNEAVERALWLAVKTLEESGALAVRLASSANAQGDTFSEELFAARAQKAAAHAATLREILVKTAGR